MTDKQIIKQLAERYKEICRSPFADGYTFTAFDGECAKKGFTRDDIKNYIEKEKQERKAKRTESIKSLKEALKAKEQECEELKGGLQILEENLKDYIEHFNKVSDELDQFKKANDEKNELLAQLGCPTVGTARQLTLSLQEQLEAYKMEAEEGKEINAELKAENETYKKMLENEEVILALNEVRSGERYLWFNKAEKYKQTLAEIRDIATCCIKGDVARIRMKQILQKISEVEDE